jgi:CPA1 family monovalent cation:H+ antiporter
MNIFEMSSILVSISAALMYINFRLLRLPMTIGLMLLSLIFSFFIFSIAFFIPQIHLFTSSVIGNIDFNITLMGGMLSFLLFAGSLHVDLNDLFEQKVIISILATLGVLFSTLLVGTITYYVLGLFSININYIYCLLFGSLISPTDPIAVLGLLKETNAPKSLETTIAGESLFNDGVGVVVSNDFGAFVSFNNPSTAIGSVGEINEPNKRQ